MNTNKRSYEKNVAVLGLIAILRSSYRWSKEVQEILNCCKRWKFDNVCG